MEGSTNPPFDLFSHDMARPLYLIGHNRLYKRCMTAWSNTSRHDVACLTLFSCTVQATKVFLNGPGESVPRNCIDIAWYNPVRLMVSAADKRLMLFCC